MLQADIIIDESGYWCQYWLDGGPAGYGEIHDDEAGARAEAKERGATIMLIYNG